MAEDIDCRMTLIPAEGTFAFDCRPEVPCFNACCRNLNQALTPYDVLRLARGLKLPTGEFLRRYTVCRTGPGSGLPIVSLVPGDPQSLTCPLLSASGCSVYPDRPSSCRTYPLVRVVRRARETGLRSEEFMLLREPHCRGVESGRAWTPAEWTANHGLQPYPSENDRLLDLIGFKNRFHPRPLPPSKAAEAAACLYDPDRLHGEPGGAVEDTASAAVAPTRADDLARLHLGLERVKRLLAPQAADGAHARGPSWS
jgi:Fe-S-cluster containining protein